MSESGGKLNGEAKPNGRPTKLTPELQAELVALLADGVPISPACDQVGIDPKSYRDWIRWGRSGEGKEPYASFSLAVTRARSSAVIDLLATAKGGDEAGTSNGPAKCAQWALERLFPKQFAPRLNVKIEEELEGLLDVVERVCSAKDCGCYEALLRAIAARDGSEAPGAVESEAVQPIH